MPYADKAKERECVTRYKREHKYEINARTRQLRLLNPEQFKAYTTKYRLSLPLEVRKERRRKSYLKRKAKELETCKLWAKAHPETIRKGCRKWKAKNPARCSYHRHLRRARLRNATIGDTSIIERWEHSWRKQKKAKCYWCLSIFPTKKCVIDHVVSLSRGGSHSIDNVCISCRSCNFKKHARSLSVWSESLSSPALF